MMAEKRALEDPRAPQPSANLCKHEVGGGGGLTRKQKGRKEARKGSPIKRNTRLANYYGN